MRFATCVPVDSLGPVVGKTSRGKGSVADPPQDLGFPNQLRVINMLTEARPSVRKGAL